MIEKSIIVMAFMYAVSSSMLAGQIILGVAFDVTLVSPVNGQPIESHIAGALNEGVFNEQTQSIIEANFTGNTTYYDRVETFATSAAFIAWELITLLTGTHIFTVIILMGVPLESLIPFITIYVILLARTAIGIIRGI